MRRLHFLVLVGVTAVVAAAACGGPPPPPPPPEPNADSIAAAQAQEDSIRRAQEEAERLRQEEAERARRESESASERARIADELRSTLAVLTHFDYDRSDIRPGDAAILDQKVAILSANPNLRIRISGHCDERGSDEYNLALGNRRATSAKQYLVSHGIDASRIETVSFGEERPIAMGRDEDSWAQNRRDEFEIIGGGEELVRP
ncbi:MAG TPA: peptidoglycan-associated lipoprotein Pal [Gemmatimonadales bacterium]